MNYCVFKPIFQCDIVCSACGYELEFLNLLILLVEEITLSWSAMAALFFLDGLLRRSCLYFAQELNFYPCPCFLNETVDEAFFLCF